MNPTFSVTQTPAQRGRPPGTGAKRGRKPRGAAAGATPNSPRPTPVEYAHVHWSLPESSPAGSKTEASPQQLGSAGPSRTSTPGFSIASPRTGVLSLQQSTLSSRQQPGSDSPLTPLTSQPLNPAHLPSAAGLISFADSGNADPLQSTAPLLAGTTMVQNPVSPTVGSGTAPITGILSLSGPTMHGVRAEEEAEADDELLPAMADDDYSAQLSWQSQSKDNLKVLMDNFSPAQYERFEAYRRHALPKQAVRKVVQQALGQQVSQPVAQVVAGFAKVFVGEIVEKARAVQERRGDVGPLSPDHLREAYRLYQLETGRVGAARPLRAKRLFVK